MFALTVETKDGWDKKGYTIADVPEPKLDEAKNPDDAKSVIIKMKFAGVCGSDRGIWYRQAFKDQILNTLKEEGKTARITGHEVFGEVVSAGSEVANLYDVNVGQAVSADCHVICQVCFQCKNDQKNVCTNEKILGISHEGIYAEYVKLPGHILWKVNTDLIRPEVAAVHDPFGNAVHCATKVDLKGKTIAIFGLGPIGTFLLLAAQGLGAKKIIGIDPNPMAREMANRLGIDHVLELEPNKDHTHKHDQKITDKIMELTDGLGVDVAFEMAGFNDSVNNAIFATRRGGDVILFGVKNGDFIFEDYNRLIVRGITMHAVVGREMWRTWDNTKKLFEDPATGVQDKIWNIMLNQGNGTILPIREYTDEKFEKMMNSNPKILFSF